MVSMMQQRAYPDGKEVLLWKTSASICTAHILSTGIALCLNICQSWVRISGLMVAM